MKFPTEILFWLKFILMGLGVVALSTFFFVGLRLYCEGQTAYRRYKL